jgi:hypothetical protein
MRTISVLDTANGILEQGIANERRGEWSLAADKYQRAAALFVEARAWADAEDALRRAGTCAVVADKAQNGSSSA